MMEGALACVDPLLLLARSAASECRGERQHAPNRSPAKGDLECEPKLLVIVCLVHRIAQGAAASRTRQLERKLRAIARLNHARVRPIA